MIRISLKHLYLENSECSVPADIRLRQEPEEDEDEDDEKQDDPDDETGDEDNDGYSECACPFADWRIRCE